MKNVCKKLFSLMLVAVLLVSIVPFSAMAAGEFVDLVMVPGKTMESDFVESDYVRVHLVDGKVPADKLAEMQGICSSKGIIGWTDGSNLADKVFEESTTLFPVFATADPEPTPTPTPTPDPDPAPVNYIDVVLVDGKNDNSSFAASEYKRIALQENGKVSAEDFAMLQGLCSKDIIGWSLTPGATSGSILSDMVFKHTGVDTVYPVFKKSTTTPPTTTPPTTEKPDDKEDDKVSAKEYTVKLKFYTNDNATAVRVVDITNTYALDNVIAWKEVQQYVKDNFVASNSLGINIDGIYKYEGSAWSNWVTSGYKASDVEIPAYGYRHDHITLMVMLTGYSGGKVSLKSSSNNNSDNPKTGDNIFVAATFMAVSATALTAVYVYNKKRMVK